MDERLKKVLLGLGPTLLITFGFIGWRVASGRKTQPSAALNINLEGPPEEVWIDGEQRGQTPFYSDTLQSGETQVKIASWSARLNLNPGTLTAVNLDLGEFTKEEIFWLEKSDDSKISVISDPEGAQVTMGGKSKGVTPLFAPASPGPYELEVSKEGYQTANLKVQIQPEYKLNAWFKLRPDIMPQEPAPISMEGWGWEGKQDLVTLIDYSISNVNMFLNTPAWISALEERFESEPPSQQPHYYLDSTGKVYDDQGQAVKKKEEGISKITAGYLGRSGEEIPREAKEGFVQFLEESFPAQSKPKVKISPTGVGFLRVRSGAGTGFPEITKIDPGDEFPLLEEKGSWFRIMLDDGREGWISARFAEKVED